MVGVPVAYATGLWLKATGTVVVRFSNTPISSHGPRGRSRIGGTMLQIHFGDRLPWELRNSLPEQPGIYAIIKNDRIIYYGKTWCGGGLRGRIGDFHRSARTGFKGHAGGVTYQRRYGDDLSDLSVAVHVPHIVSREPSVLYSYIQYAERRLIWEHVERYGALPACNSE
jgi:hypothetical protein